MTDQVDEVDTLARTIYGEARGEYHGGRVAIANVIMHRVRADIGNDGKPDWWGEGVIGVCRAKGQFTSWNNNDPNRPVIDLVTGENLIFSQCIAIAGAAISGRLPDLVFGSTHYHTVDVHPVWSRGHKPIIQIGRHLFFNSVK